MISSITMMESVYQTDVYREEIDKLQESFGWASPVVIRQIFAEGVRALLAEAEQMEEMA